MSCRCKARRHNSASRRADNSRHHRCRTRRASARPRWQWWRSSDRCTASTRVENRRADSWRSYRDRPRPCRKCRPNLDSCCPLGKCRAGNWGRCRCTTRRCRIRRLTVDMCRCSQRCPPGTPGSSRYKPPRRRTCHSGAGTPRPSSQPDADKSFGRRHKCRACRSSRHPRTPY